MPVAPRGESRRRARRPGWAWIGIQKVLAEATRPLTPTEARAALSSVLGEPVSLSTVKNTLSRHACLGGELLRLEGGRYELRDRKT